MSGSRRSPSPMFRVLSQERGTRDLQQTIENASRSFGSGFFDFLAIFQLNIRTRPSYAMANGFLLAFGLGILMFLVLWGISWISYGLKNQEKRNNSDACTESMVNSHLTSLASSKPTPARLDPKQVSHCGFMNQLRLDMKHEPFEVLRDLMVWLLLVAVTLGLLFYMRARLFTSRAAMYKSQGFPNPVDNALMDARKAEIVGGFF